MKLFVLLSLLAAAASLAPVAVATGDLPVGVNDCDGGNVCLIVRADPCVGVGLGLQGVLACGDVDERCATVYVGFNPFEACGPGIVVGGVPSPVLVVEPHRVCAGVVQDGVGSGACAYYASGDACVVFDTGGAYWRHCETIVEPIP